MTNVGREFKCEICYDWCKRIEITKQWWNVAEKDWKELNGKDLPIYIATLSVFRETTKEIFYDKDYSKNHSVIREDKNGYSLSANQNCSFQPLSESQKIEWNGLVKTIRAFRNGSAHITKVKPMNPYHTSKKWNHEDSSQNYYRYAPKPDLHKDNRHEKPCNLGELRQIHEIINQAILKEIRSPPKRIDQARIKYELLHVERGVLIDLIHLKLTELLKEIRVF